MIAYVGSFCTTGVSTCATGTEEGYVFLNPGALPSESVILNTQRDATSTATALLNPAQSIANGTGSDSGTAISLYDAQSFAAPASAQYLARAAFLVGSNNGAGCSGTLTVSVANALQEPWSGSIEFANLTATFTESASAGYTTIAADFINGTLTSNSAKLTLGSASLSTKGVSTTSTANFSPLIDPALAATWYVRSAIYSTACTSSNLEGMVATTASTYASGTLWTSDGTTWTQQVARDAMNLDLRAYGGKDLTFTLTTNSQNAFGALYATVFESTTDPGACAFILCYNALKSNLFGPSIFGAGTLDVETSSTFTRDYRIGYFGTAGQAYTSAQTLTITLNDSIAIHGRNLLYQVTFPNNVAHTDVGNLTLAGTGATLQLMQLFSTNDFQSTVYVTVRACQTSPDPNTGACPDSNPSSDPIIPNGSWTATIFGNGGSRTTGGLWDANGNFSFSGQDVTGAYTSLTLSAIGYATLTQPFTLPNTGGNYFANVTMSSQGSFTLIPSGVALTWMGNNTPIVPNSLQVNVTRSVHVPVYLDAVRFQTGTFIQAISTPVYWSTSQNDTISVTWPTLNRATTGGEAGTYLYYGTNVTGTLLTNTEPYCLYASASTWSATCAVTLSVGDQNDLANFTTNRIGLLSQATQDASLSQQKADAEAAVVPFLSGFLTPLDKDSTHAGTWWFTPASIILIASWLILAIAAVLTVPGRLVSGANRLKRGFR